MESKKIFIIHASAGAGHKKAAIAIKESLDKREHSPQGELIDILDYTNSFFKKLYVGIYIFAITYIPYIWGFFYYLLDNKKIYFLLSWIRAIVNKINTGEFVKFILREKPDVVISTHFLPAYIISNLKKKKLFRGKLITVITDFMPHTFWLSEETDTYVVAAENTKIDLETRGVPAGKIKVLGIPVSELFYQQKDKACIRKILNIEEKPFTILVVSGGFGVGPVEEIVDGINKLNDRLKKQIGLIVVCGKNEHLFNKLKNTKYDMFVKIYGFVNNMDELMQISDLIITKAGGLTVSESLTKNLPMVIIAPIPGQETNNYKLLKKNNACISVKKVRDVKKEIENIFKNKKSFRKIKENIKNLSCNFSAKKILDLVILE